VSFCYAEQLPKKSAGLSAFSGLELVNSSCFVDFLSAILVCYCFGRADEEPFEGLGQAKNVAKIVTLGV
jgi:hypothetical protein